MKRPVRENDGTYHIKGKQYKELFGSREKVWNHTAYKTPGGLTRSQLLMNKRGRIVSKDKFQSSTKEHKMGQRLFKHYTAKKGKFGAVKKHKSKNTRKKNQ